MALRLPITTATIMNTSSTRVIKTQWHRRKRLLIDPRVQSRIIKGIAWPAALCLIATSIVVTTLCYRLVDEALVAQIELPSVTPLLIALAVFLVASLGFTIYTALSVSHRIVGPLFRIRVVMDGVRNGQLSARARVRSRDYLPEFATFVNEFLDWVEREHSNPPAPTSGESARSITAGEGATDDTAVPALAQHELDVVHR
jgi:hypothetical protein